MTDVSIIILSYNTKELLRACLQAIYSHISGITFEVIVVDNASHDDSVAMVKKEFSSVKIIENKENDGFTKGCNVGAAHAKGEYLFFLNSDALVQDNSLQKAIEFLRRHGDYAVLGGQLMKGDKPQKSFGNFYDLFHVSLWLLGAERFYISQSTTPRQVDWVSGGCMMIKRDVFASVHGFDEQLFMYMEDSELCYRIKKSGKQIYYYPALRVDHLGQGSSNRSFAIINIYKGLLYFYRKHRNPAEYGLLRLLLYTKALASFMIGVVMHNKYLKDTYSAAMKI